MSKRRTLLDAISCYKGFLKHKSIFCSSIEDYDSGFVSFFESNIASLNLKNVVYITMDDTGKYTKHTVSRECKKTNKLVTTDEVIGYVYDHKTLTYINILKEIDVVVSLPSPSAIGHHITTIILFGKKFLLNSFNFAVTSSRLMFLGNVGLLSSYRIGVDDNNKKIPYKGRCKGTWITNLNI